MNSMSLRDRPADAFGAITLAEQLAALGRALEDGDDPRGLLELTATLRDPQPLAWLTTRLFERRWAARGEQRRWLAGFLIEQPETAVHKVLKALTSAEEAPDADVCETLVAALEIVPVARLATLCLLDRSLKHHFPERREAHVEAILERVRASLRATGDVQIDLLAQVRAESFPELAAAAPDADAFEARRAELARAVVEVLAGAPKAVSQTNAEDLLSRRVYTDPGHFLIELLQNAEDAGAGTWRIVFEPGRLVVWHDGTPFDARDVVGVCSIGQTTKKKQQIGFFGVGFKSVYEVTDRPQIYSDVYSFEIADVSIPRLLRRRPPDLPPDGTVLVLPLRDPEDPDRSPRRLYEKAASLDPCVLLTLPSIDVIDLELAETGERHKITELTRPGQQETTQRKTIQQHRGWQRHYLLEQADVVWDGHRDAGRADRTRIMVGLRTGSDDVPRPLREGAATVYSFLPTNQHSGLRFFIQAHFDVPVDRERLNPESRWNALILDQVPGLLARVMARVAADGRAQTETGCAGGAPRRNAQERARGFLSVLPRHEELGAPIVRRVADGLAPALREIACLPGADGEPHPPAQTLIAPLSVVSLFGGEPIDARLVGGAAGRLFFLDPSPERETAERERALAQALGCRELHADELADVLERALGEAAAVRPEELPAALREPAAGAQAQLLELLHGLVEARERRGDPVAPLLERLSALPLIPCDDGTSRPASGDRQVVSLRGDGPAQASPALRVAYGGLRPFVARRFDALMPGESPPARVTELFDRLGVPRLDLEGLVADLEAVLQRVTVLDQLDSVALPGSRERLDDILTVLAPAPWELLERAAALPLFEAEDGRYHPATGEGGAVRVEAGATGDALKRFYRGRRPIASGGPGPGRELLERLGVPRLTLETLVADLEQGLLVAPKGRPEDTVAGLRRLHGLLEEVRSEIPRRLRETLVELPIWPDGEGTARPLTGPDAARIPASETVLELLDHLPYLDAEVRARAHVADMEAPEVGAAEVLAAFTARPELFADGVRRRRFQHWLVASESAVMSDADQRGLIASLAFCRSAGGRLLAPRELVLDPDLPDLGIDWRPHAEIEQDLLDLLSRHLGSGRPKLETLVRKHLRPAYHAAANAEDGARAAEILGYLAARLGGRSDEGIRGLLPGILIEDQHGRFREPGDLVLPEPAVREHVWAVWGESGSLPAPHPERLPTELHAFLIALGVRRRPSRQQLRAALCAEDLTAAAALGLAGLLGGKPEIQALVQALPLIDTAWVPVGHGRRLRRPGDLFLPNAEIEKVVGHDPELFADRYFLALAGSGLTAALGFKTLDEVTLGDAVRHIERRAAEDRIVPLAVYRWLDDALGRRRIDAGELVARLADRPWISTDDGDRLYPDQQVLGTWALALFGRRRGYWPTGIEHCPRLCRLFAIPGEVTAEAVAGLLEEIAREVEGEGDQRVLDLDPAVPRMLVACQAFLGERAGSEPGPPPGEPTAEPLIPKTWPVILACSVGPPAGGRDRHDRRRLVAAGAAGLYRSDAPTLEALFSRAGELLLAEAGGGEERPGLDRFLDLMGVPLLRNAYTVEAADSGRDVTDECRQELQSWRTTLRALVSVLPRVEAQRTLLRQGGWVYRERLASLGAAGRIRAIRELQVRLVLPGVGSVETATPAAYDPRRDALLVDAAALAEPADHVTGLASGLMPCIYDGPGEDQLIDVVEILLPQATAPRMNAYLDRRHFPRVAAVETAGERLATRLGEILDFGLAERLAMRFPALAAVDLEAWRSGELPRRLRRAEDPEAAAALLLAGPPEADEELTAALATLFRVASLSDVPRDLLGSVASVRVDEIEERSVASPRAEGSEVGVAAGRRSEGPESPVEEEVASAPSPRGGASGGFLGGLARLYQGVRDVLALGGGSAAAGEGAYRDADPGAEETPSLRGANVTSSAAPFGSPAFIGPQFGAGQQARMQAAGASADAVFVHRPASLPPPYLYAVSALGASFDARHQRWLPAGAYHGWKRALRRSGHKVVFHGRLPPGRHQLPVPLYGRMAGNIGVDASPELIGKTRRDAHGQIVLQVLGAAPVTVRYEIDLLEVPELGAARRAGGAAPARVDDRLLAPTLAPRRLPREVRTWLAGQRARQRSPWEQATAAADLVKSRYLYDEGYLERPEVRGKRLKPGGNHHLELMHAAGDDRWLGRGVCYELNLLVVELLRHLRVPAMAGTGWLLGEGRLIDPDHLFALAVVESTAGPVLLPLDAAAGARGPIRLPRRTRAPEVPVPADGLPVPAVGGAWEAVFHERQVAESPAKVRAARLADRHHQAELAERAVRMVYGAHAMDLPADAMAAFGDAARLRQVLDEALGSPSLAAALLDLLRGSYDDLPAVPPQVHELARLGLARVTTVPHYRVEPAEPSLEEEESVS